MTIHAQRELPAPRWSVLAPVTPKRGSVAASWSAVNISATGMFVTGDPLLEPGTVIDVDIVLPGAYGPSTEITSKVQIVWKRLSGEASWSKPAGMGVRFVGTDERAARELRSYLDELARHQGVTPPPQWAVAAANVAAEPAAAAPASVMQGAEELPELELELVDVAPGRSPSAKGPPARSGLTPPPAPLEMLGVHLPTPPPARTPSLRLVTPPAPAAPAPPSKAPAPPAPPPEALLETSAKPDSAAGKLLRTFGPGTTLGNYELERRLGSGGMGDVFLAQHRLLGRRVALKLLHEQHVHDRAALRRFYDEARLVNQIRHENIVEITDLCVGDEAVFIVMELLEGSTVSDALGRAGPFSPARVATIGAQLCEALDAVHQAGIVHRDLKPENVMLIKRGANRDFVKLLDFGIAKLRGDLKTDGKRTQVGQVVGTPGYMAPEQLMGQPADHRADLYALGVVLFAMLTATLPYRAPSFPEMMIKQVTEPPPAPSARLGRPLPAALDALVMRCLERVPRNRPASAGDIGAQLLAAVGAPAA